MSYQNRKGFPGISDSKESVSNVGDLGLTPRLGRFPGEGNGNPFQYSCLGNTIDRGAWRATLGSMKPNRVTVSDLPWGYNELDMTMWPHTHTHTHTTIKQKKTSYRIQFPSLYYGYLIPHLLYLCKQLEHLTKYMKKKFTHWTTKSTQLWYLYKGKQMIWTLYLIPFYLEAVSRLQCRRVEPNKTWRFCQVGDKDWSLKKLNLLEFVSQRTTKEGAMQRQSSKLWEESLRIHCWRQTGACVGWNSKRAVSSATSKATACWEALQFWPARVEKTQWTSQAFKRDSRRVRLYGNGAKLALEWKRTKAHPFSSFSQLCLLWFGFILWQTTRVKYWETILTILR